MLYASKYSTPDNRITYQQKGEYFFSKALEQFFSFQTADLMRPLVLLTQNGLMHGFSKKTPDFFEPKWERNGLSKKVKDNLYKKQEFSCTRCLFRFSPKREIQFLKWRIIS